MRRASTVLLLLLLAAAGCRDGGSFKIYVEFPDDQAVGQTKLLWVAASQIPPGGDCTQLVSGNARPGEDGYQIDDQVFIPLDAIGGSSDLNNVGPGPRLFFAEAVDDQDNAILNGCTWSLTGSSGDDLIVISLDWIAECEVDADCPDDELWCNGQDRCQDGQCVTEERDCSHLESECNTASCDELQDACVLTTNPDGSSCNDGLYCSEGETCLSGECQGGEPLDCSEVSGACLAIPVCDEVNDACVGEPLPAGTICNPGSFCIAGGTCDGAGSCVGLPRDCSALDNQCNRGVCDEDADACTTESINEGLACDDGLYCTGGDSCSQGACTGTGIDCSDGDDCTVDSCYEFESTCLNSWTPNPGAEGLAIPGTCDDGMDNDCDHSIDLDDPECQPCQVDGDCDDGDVCTTNSCNADHQCETASNNGVECDDGVNCTTGDECTDRQCVGQPLDCSTLTTECSHGFCIEETSRCAAMPINQGQACTDSKFCSVDTTCIDGTCSGGTERDCSAHTDACNVGVCNELGAQCEPDPRLADTPCDDGAYCNGEDLCDGLGGCMHEGDPCSGSSACDSTCNELGENCHAPLGTPCGDQSDSACDDPDSCDGSGACVTNTLADGASCDDGIYCTGIDTCSAAVCVHAGDPCLGGAECNNVCRELIDSCRAETGTPCGDPTDIVCNGADSCSINGECLTNLAGAGTSCDDGQYCTGADTCDGSGNCDHTGDPCGAGEMCDEGQEACVPEAVPGAFVALGSGSHHVCGITPQGDLYCWGLDNEGQLGDGGANTNSSVPVEVDIGMVDANDGFVQVDGGNKHSCGLTAGGRIFCWGDDSWGQLGNGTSGGNMTVPYPINTAEILGEEFFIQVACGLEHSCGLAGDGQVHCWGKNDKGQVGAGTDDSPFEDPEPVYEGWMAGETSFVYLDANGNHTCAITGQGLAYCWGDNTTGQLGDGTTTQKLSPWPMDVGGMSGCQYFISFHLGWTHSCAITADHQAYCWGSDLFGALGSGFGQTDSSVPVAVDVSSIPGSDKMIGMAAGKHFSLAVAADGRSYGWGVSVQGQLGNGSNQMQVLPVAMDSLPGVGSKPLIQVVAGESHACGLTVDHHAFCWGWDDHGQCGDGSDNTTKFSPVAVTTANVQVSPTFTEVCSGDFHACGLTATGEIYCWGYDEYGMLGDGNDDNFPEISPLQVDTSNITGDPSFARLFCGGWHNCGVTGEGKAYCWGWDDKGQVGDGGSSSNAFLPTAVQSSHVFLHIEGGFTHTCGVSAVGLVYCWGNDSQEQLGNGLGVQEEQSPAALQGDIVGLYFAEVCAGGYHSCARTTTGELYCWGRNQDGQLGIGSTGAPVAFPADIGTANIGGDKSIKTIACGSSHTCAITSAGAGYCWGLGDEGEMGSGWIGSTSVPEPLDSSFIVASFSWKGIVGGSAHTCGWTADGVGYCWGSDDAGQLGNPAIGQTSVPYPVNASALGLGGFTGMSTGLDSSCAVSWRGQPVCWGSDLYGQVGNGSPTDTSYQSPELVDISGL